MNNFVTGWLASEDAAQDVIHLKRIYIKINDDNLYDGVMFSQIMFWHGRNKETGKPRMKIKKQGHLWLAKKYSDWQNECGINEHTAKKCINRIRERNLIIVKLWKFDNTPTLHIRINWDEFEKRIMSNRPERSNPLDTRGLINQTLEVDSITETTSKNTTESKSIAAYAAPPPPSLNGTNGNHKPDTISGNSPKQVPSAKKEPSLHQQLMAAYQDALGYKIRNGAADGKAAKQILDEGYTVAQVIDCYQHMKRDSFWQGKHIPLLSVYKQLGAFVQSQNGNGRTNGNNMDAIWQSIRLAVGQPGRPDIPERALMAIGQMAGGWRRFKEQDARFLDQLRPDFEAAYERTQQPTTV